MLWSQDVSRPVQSLPAVAFAWRAIDRDGPETVRSFVYWLTYEGEAAADSFFTADTVVVLRPAAFGPAGSPRPGSWTLHVQAIDNVQARSAAISHAWTVELPHGRYLLVDNTNSSTPGGANEDFSYRSVMDSLAANDYDIMDIEEQGGFRAALEVGPVLGLYRGVVWYSGAASPTNDASVAENLARADQANGLRDYLSGGGRVVLCARNAVGDSAALSSAFQQEVLGIADFYKGRRVGDPHRDYWSGNLDLPRNSLIHTMLGGQEDSLRTSNTVADVDFLILDSDVAPIFTVAPGFLAATWPASQNWVFQPDDQTIAPAAVGLLSRRFGRMAVSSVLPSRGGTESRLRVMAALLRAVLID